VKPWIWKRTVLLALACAGAQLGAGSAVVAGVATLGRHGIGHEHSVSILAEDGHLHLVLSHVEPAEHDHEPAAHGDDPHSTCSNADHVFHLDSADNATLRRAMFDPAPALAVSVDVLPALAPRQLSVLPPEPRARGVDHLRTVVLRL
jgi:hypothetical protein